MDKRIKRFLKNSFISMFFICIVVFTGLTLIISNKTEESITEVSEIYMSEMNIQLQQKFSSIIGLRLQQVEGIISITPPDTAVYCDEMLAELKTSVEVRGFSFLGFYKENGELETVYGHNIEITHEEDIVNAVNYHKDIVAQGTDENGQKILILGKQATYPLEDGGNSIALLVGIPMEYLNEVLFLYSDDAMLYSHVIDKDGNFIIRNADVYRDNYFERIKAVYDEIYGKDGEQYTKELRLAMAERKDYSTVAAVNGEERHIYCTPLSENSTWYLITVMPNGVLENSIAKLDKLRIVIMIASSVILLAAMSVVFFLYYRLSQQYMKELDEARQESIRANMAKSEFLSSMSHDIRTPMNAIVGMTEIALKNLNDSMRVEDCLRKVKLSSKHLLGLINDVLDMSKIESGKMTLNVNHMSLREVMDDIVNIVQPQVKARNQYFDIFIQKILCEDVYCDTVRFNQVLLNLLSNALKFTPEQGRINIYLYQEPSLRGEEYVQTHVVVEDNGIGMSKEFQKKIFNTFERENTEQVQNIIGTGLGMAITKCIIDLMQGSIELESELGKGSRFHVTVDLKRADVKEENMELPEWNVLVVDDNEQLCSSAVANLEELGVHAESTVDGRKAVQMIEERHKRDKDYHFVLIDWKMPNMDGVQTIYEIRKRVGMEIPVFLISAYDWSDIESEIQTAEIEGFISKPLFKSTLFSRLSQYAEGRELEQEHGKKQEINFAGKRILLAEDNDINWEIAEEILSMTGLELERAANGMECVEKFKKSEPGFYDAILMDIRMPVMNGYDATKAIRALERADKKLPIIAMTADAFSEDVQRCLDCGMNAHLAKPLDMKECMYTLQKYLS